jgi:hypothetical protein
MKIKIAAVLICVVIIPAFTFSATINVPADQSTIQAGIDATVDGDTVLVAANTYTGTGNRDIDFGGKNIVLLSADGPSMTIINCEGNESEPHKAIILQNGENLSSVIDGFIVTGAYIVNSGAIDLSNEASLTIKNCHIIDNNSRGISTGWNCGVIVTNCQISGNSDHGIWLGADADISYSLVSRNGSSGIYHDYEGIVNITNCTIVLNGWNGINLNGPPPEKNTDAGMATLSYNLVAYNLHEGFQKWFWPGGIDITCNNSYGNGDSDWGFTGAEAGDVNGNISYDPVFCDTAVSDFQISDNSPCTPDHPDNSCGILIGAFDIGCSPTGLTDIESDNILAESFKLAQNYPNPFNLSTTIEYTVPKRTQVKITVYNVLGHVVNTILDEEKPPGTFSVQWNGVDTNGATVSTGVYFYGIEMPNVIETRKMLLLK